MVNEVIICLSISLLLLVNPLLDLSPYQVNHTNQFRAQNQFLINDYNRREIRLNNKAVNDQRFISPRFDLNRDTVKGQDDKE